MSIDFKSKSDPMLDSLPDYVKDPRNFMKIQRALIETLACATSHSDPMEMAHCAKCSENMLERRELMKKFGFKSPAQYMAWRRAHEFIKERIPYDMYNRIVDNH